MSFESTTTKNTAASQDTLAIEDMSIDEYMMNYHTGLPDKEKPKFDDESELSDAPKDLLTDSSPVVSCPAAAQVNTHSVVKIAALQPPTHDAATLEGARLLASLRQAH